MYQPTLKKRRREASGVYDKAFKTVYTTFVSFQYNSIPKATFGDPPNVREAFYEKNLSKHGRFCF